MVARILAVVLLAVVAAAGPVDARTPEEAFDQGNHAYADGDYDAAAEAYRFVLSYDGPDANLAPDVRDPRVEYNLGNTEFKRGNLGLAILHFERARRLDPTDEDTRLNLQYAKSFAVDQVHAGPSSALVSAIEGAQDRLGVDRQAWGALLLVWFVCAVLVLGLARPHGFTPAVGWSMAGLLLLLGIVGASWYLTLERIEGRPLAVVLPDVVEVLAGPGENNATLFTVHEGLTVEVRSDREEWVQVSLPNGLSGWVPDGAVGRV